MRPLVVLICCLSSALWSFAREPSSGKATHSDIFLITIDTLRADHVHCYGDENIQTPALDKIAQDGIRFTQAFTPSPLTNTSHTTIMTGLLPGSHGVTNFGAVLNATHPTLAKLLKHQGYRTAAFIGAVVLDSKTLAPGLDQGFDFYDNFPAHSASNSRWGRVERRGMDVVHRAETWLSAHQTGPRFLWVHLYDPHDPYEPPAPYSRIYKDRLYDGEIAYADSALGNFISYLQKEGWYQRALVIVVGDHGEGLGEHNEETHGIFLYDSTTHVPLILKLPGKLNENLTIEAQVRTTDILPTVLDVLRLPAAAPLDGSSLTPYFDGAETSGRTVFGETNYPLSFGWAPLRSVRDKGFKFIEAPRPELYDLHSDTKELNTLYEPGNPVVLKMRAQLAALRQKHAASADASNGVVGAGSTDEFRALGYLRPADTLSSSNVHDPSLLPDPKDKIIEQNLLHAALLAVDDARVAEARTSLEKVLQMDPKSPFALMQLGELELNTGNYARAADYWKRASEVRLGDPTIAFKYGQTLNFVGDTQGALYALRASLKTNPSQYKARLLLGEIYFRLHDAKDAQDQLEAALLLQPSVEVKLKLAEVLLAQNRYAEAIEDLKPLTTPRSRCADVYDLLARAYTGLHEKEDAQQAQDRANLLRMKKGKR